MDTMETGQRILTELMGKDFVAERAEQRNGFTGPFYDHVTDVCFGRIWARPGLDRKLRSMLTIAMLVGLNRPNQLRKHVEGALNHGCTAEEIQEILLQSAVYCGLPAAGEAFTIAEAVLRDRGLIED